MSAPTTETHTTATFCRVCEPSCALTAEVSGGRVTRLKPDRTHPVTAGFACHKGLYYTAIHNDPDRLDAPLKRAADASRHSGSPFTTVSWDGAIDDIAARLQDITRQHGSTAVAGYIGNPMAFNALGSEALDHFFRQIGCQRMFSSATQDCSNKFAGAEAVFGTSTLHPVPDLENTDYALIFGENPRVSHMSFISIADPMAKFRAAVKRGAKVWFVNPRRIEAVTPATGDWLPVKPDTDLYLMAALLHELDRAGLFDEETIREHGKHIEGLRDFIAPWDADTVAQVTGLEAAQIRRIAREFGEAPSACAHMSTGVNMGRQGTLCYWLLQMLSFVTGNLDRPGGNYYAAGFYPAAKAGRADTSQVFFREGTFPEEYGPLRHIRGLLPANLLPQMIEQDAQPIRALIVLAGNPLLSVAGETHLRRAFGKLELIVVLDLFRNATAELADYVLPCADMLERRDINICGLGMQYQPYAQYTDAVVPPAAERREEWWILHRLLQAMGLPSLFDQANAGEELPLFQRLDRMLGRAGLSVAQLQAAEHHSAVLPRHTPGRFYSDWLQTEDRRVDCCPPLFSDALDQARHIFAALQQDATQPPSSTLQLINLRTHYMHNSWYQNVPQLKRAGQQDNPLHMAPDDIARLGLTAGAPITVRSDAGALQASVHADETLRPGVVAMVHGWGNQQTPGLSLAHQHPGTNVNVLLPSGPGSYEVLSNQAFMTGIPVRVSALV
ncbi:molybdopterin-dependent oxidoreductase [Alcanivorax sp. JB21]|uniref:molybdopterin-containing oxidoreductase family protein n=1 Tax=Alcanivorax limicola TaxID=2874102 RepID=UPI001CBBF936|nr:molybdopterin-dependent oxidoreductase [Alcanivorax limicola]MBZ2188694.1 molybdopterin-dependent oxidoreductase [Alcanivorax limicola]